MKFIILTAIMLSPIQYVWLGASLYAVKIAFKGNENGRSKNIDGRATKVANINQP